MELLPSLWHGLAFTSALAAFELLGSVPAPLLPLGASCSVGGRQESEEALPQESASLGLRRHRRQVVPAIGRKCTGYAAQLPTAYPRARFGSSAAIDFRLERALDSPTIGSCFLQARRCLPVGALASWFGTTFFAAVAATAGVVGWKFFVVGDDRVAASVGDVFVDVLRHGAFLGFVGLTFLFAVRVILVRFGDPET